MATRSASIRGAVIVAAAMLAASVTASAVGAQEPQQLYAKNCASCHGATGKGDGSAGKFLKPPPSDFATALKGKADADIAKIITEGGKAVGKSAMMPGYGSKLSDEQIQSLVEYVKGLVSN